MRASKVSRVVCLRGLDCCLKKRASSSVAEGKIGDKSTFRGLTEMEANALRVAMRVISFPRRSIRSPNTCKNNKLKNTV